MFLSSVLLKDGTDGKADSRMADGLDSDIIQEQLLYVVMTEKNTFHRTAPLVKKQDTILFPIISPNVDRFSKFFHRHTQQ